MSCYLNIDTPSGDHVYGADSFVGEEAVLTRTQVGRTESCVATTHTAVLEIPRLWVAQLSQMVIEDKQSQRFSLVKQTDCPQAVQKDHLTFHNLLRRQYLRKKLLRNRHL